MSSVRLTCTVCLPLQGRWRYSNSYDLLRPCRLLSCEAARARIRSGCSCSEGTGWRAEGSAAQWLRCGAPTCRLCGHLASSCGEGHRTLSHCHGLEEMAKNTAILRISKDLYFVGWRKMRTHFNNMLAHSTNISTEGCTGLLKSFYSVCPLGAFQK